MKHYSIQRNMYCISASSTSTWKGKVVVYYFKGNRIALKGQNYQIVLPNKQQIPILMMVYPFEESVKMQQRHGYQRH
jgi:hypothetical protein